MLQSMTGYGKSAADFADKTITVEIRSLNSKGLDASLRMPSLFREKEIELQMQDKEMNKLDKELEIKKLEIELKKLEIEKLKIEKL